MATHGTPQPQLGQLFADFMRTRAAGPEIEPFIAEVLPYQASGVHPVDPRLALEEAVEAAAFLLPANDAEPFKLNNFKVPGCWGMLVRAHDGNLGVPLCLGNFPQMIRDIAPFLAGKDLAKAQAKPAQPLDLGDQGELEAWGVKMLAKDRPAEALFAVAALRMVRRFDESERLLQQVQLKGSPVPLLENERAALAWHRGQNEAAKKLWAAHPKQQSPAVLFNRGVAALFTDQPREAAHHLTQALAVLPDKSAWHHLGRLYLLVAGNLAAE